MLALSITDNYYYNLLFCGILSNFTRIRVVGDKLPLNVLILACHWCRITAVYCAAAAQHVHPGGLGGGARLPLPLLPPPVSAPLAVTTAADVNVSCNIVV